MLNNTCILEVQHTALFSYSTIKKHCSDLPSDSFPGLITDLPEQLLTAVKAAPGGKFGSMASLPGGYD